MTSSMTEGWARGYRSTKDRRSTCLWVHEGLKRTSPLDLKKVKLFQGTEAEEHMQGMES